MSSCELLLLHFERRKPHRLVGDAVLKGINMSVLPGQLVAIVGQVGSGKSSLIQAVLGELTKLNGDVAVRGSVAYVAQTAFIMNATLKVR